MIVYKYEILNPIDGRVYMTLPLDAYILTAAFQGDTPVLWVASNHPHVTGTRALLLLMTGQKIDDSYEDWTHVVTLTSPDGIVYHLFR